MPTSDPILDALDQVQGRSAPPPQDTSPSMGWAIVNGERVPVENGGKDDHDIMSALDQVQQPDKRSLFSKAYDAVFTPPEIVTQTAADVANAIDAPSLDRSPMRA